MAADKENKTGVDCGIYLLENKLRYHLTPVSLSVSVRGTEGTVSLI